MTTPTMNQGVSVVGLFDTSNEAQSAIQELVNQGVTREEISLVSNHSRAADAPAANRTVDEGTRTDTGTVDGTSVGENVAAGTLFGGLGGLLIGLGALAIPGIGPVVAAGPIAAALAGAGFGALGGGVIAGLKQVGVPEHEADVYAEAVRRGGTIVTVTTNHASADQVADILNRNGAVDVDDRGQSYRQSGWSRFDPNAGPYTPADYQDTTASLGEATRRTTSSSDVRNTRVYPTQGSSSFSDPATSAYSQPSSQYNPSVPTSTPQTSDYDTDFRRDYESRYGSQANANYDDYRPAYEYGHRMSQDSRYANRQFDDVESDLRRDYESQYPHHPWENIKSAVRTGWDKMTGQR